MELIDERIIELSELAKNKKEIVADWLRFVEENKMSICQFDKEEFQLVLQSSGSFLCVPFFRLQIGNQNSQLQFLPLPLKCLGQFQ